MGNRPLCPQPSPSAATHDHHFGVTTADFADIRALKGKRASKQTRMQVHGGDEEEEEEEDEDEDEADTKAREEDADASDGATHEADDDESVEDDDHGGEHDPHDVMSSSTRTSMWQQVVDMLSPPSMLADSSAQRQERGHRHCKRRRTGSTAATPRHARVAVDIDWSATVAEQKHHAFWELVQKLLALNDVVDMVRVLQEYLVEHVGATQSAAFLVDTSSNTVSRVIHGRATRSLLRPQRGLVGLVRESKQGLCRCKFTQMSEYDAEIDLLQESPAQKLLCVPLIDNENVYAVVQATILPKPLVTHDDDSRPVDRKVEREVAVKYNHLDAEEELLTEREALDIKLLSWLGPILGACMRKCIQYHDVLLSERTQKALLHIISSSESEDTVLNLVDEVIVGACHITKAERVSLFMIDWENDELWALSTPLQEEPMRVPLGASALGNVAHRQQILNIRDPITDSRFAGKLNERWGIDTRCALYVPVGVVNARHVGEQRCRPIAVLEILNKEGGGNFTLDDECAFEAFASEVAVILRRRNNEIQYIKLLADTRADKVLAERAKSQVNLLEYYTETVVNSTAERATYRVSTPSKARESESDMSSQTAVGVESCTASPRCSAPHRKRVPLWDFNIFAMDEDDLPGLVCDIFLDFNVDKVLHTDVQTLMNFIMAVKECYHPNPFHNFLHAVAVMHSTYTILKTTDAKNMLQPFDIAASLVAAYCHDIDHPGHSNAFEVMSHSPLAVLYSDESVLEHHHASTTFRLLAKEKSANILQNLSAAEFRYVRKVIITAILGTDMAQHFKMCDALDKVVHPIPRQQVTSAMRTKTRESLATNLSSAETKACCCRSSNGQDLGANFPRGVLGATCNDSMRNEGATKIVSAVRDAIFQNEATRNAEDSSGYGSTSQRSAIKGTSSHTKCVPSPGATAPLFAEENVFSGTLEDRLLLVKVIVHASDLGGQVFPTAVALKWSNMIAKEFAHQALIEQAEDLPVSYQQVDDPLRMVEGQHFFADKIVLPLWRLICEMFPTLNGCLANLERNVAHYVREMERLKSQPGEPVSAVHKNEQHDGFPSTINPAYNCFDEGMAMPGLARCIPAMFHSFRVAKTQEPPYAGARTPCRSAGSVFGARIIKEIEKSSTYSVVTRSQSTSTVSSAGIDDDSDDDEVVTIDSLESPDLFYPGS